MGILVPNYPFEQATTSKLLTATRTASATTTTAVSIDKNAWLWSIGGSPDGYQSVNGVKYLNCSATSPSWVAGPAVNVMRDDGTLQGALYTAMANAWGKYIYVYGGGDENFVHLETMIRLDVTNLAAKWSYIDYGGGQDKYNGVSATLNGIFYYIAGFTASGGFVYDTSSFNPATNVYTSYVSGADLPTSVGIPEIVTQRGCALSYSGSLYYMRGFSFLKWTPGDSAWTNISTSAPWQNSGNPSCAIFQGKIVQMAGNQSTTYDPATGIFATLPGTSERNHNHPIAQVCGGSIFAPVATSKNPILVDRYGSDGVWVAGADYSGNVKGEYMTTVSMEIAPVPE
jgi:hypothetical protein